MLNTFIEFLPAQVCAVMAMLLFLKGGNHRRLSYMMAVAMLLSAFNSLYYVYYFYATDFVCFYRFDMAYAYTVLCTMPVLCLCIEHMTQGTVSRRLWLLLFVPSIAYSLTITVLYIILGPDESVLFVQETYFKASVAMTESPALHLMRLLNGRVFNYVFIVQVLSIGIFCWYRLIGYKRKLSEFYSFVANKGYREGQRILYCVLASCLLSMIISSFDSLRYYAPRELFLSVSLLYTVIYFCIGRNALKVEYTMSDLPHDRSDGTVSVRQQNLVQIDERLVAMMHGEKLYLNPELTLADVAQRLNTNRSYVSNAINRIENMSFIAFVNNFRIEDAKRAMLDNRSLSMESVATMTGFTNYTSFYRVFTQKEGQSPAAWLKSQPE